MQSRTGKQCRERYMNHLDPSIKKSAWTRDEDNLIRTMHEKLGSQWSQYVPFLPGRADNAIKNRYHVISKHALACDTLSLSEPSSKRSRSTKSTDSLSDVTPLPPRATKRSKKMEILYAMRRRIDMEIAHMEHNPSSWLISAPTFPNLPHPPLPSLTHQPSLPAQSCRSSSGETNTTCDSNNLDSFDFDLSTLNAVLGNEEHILWDKWFHT